MTLTGTRRLFLVLALFAALAGAATVLFSGAVPANAEIDQGVVVPDVARRDLPAVLDGQVRAHAQVGDRIFVGGDFQQVELPDGTVLDQAHIFAYDINTGVFDPNFRPILNNSVNSLETSADGTGLYVGGRFFRWETPTGTHFPLRIAKLDAFGNLDTGFNASASAVVLSIQQIGADLYIGGDFTDVSGTAVTGIARLDAATGAVDTSFDVEIDGSVAGPQLVRGIVAHPDGSELFVLHFGTLVNNEVRRAVFKLDIDAPVATLSGWEVPWLEQQGDRLCQGQLRDIAISPDGSFIVIGGQGADNPPNCDSVLRYETAGDQVVDFTWSARMYSSVFSLAVSDVAVYVGGHFCAAPRVGAIYPGGLTSDFTGTANGCRLNDPTNQINPSERDPVNAVFRSQLAALDPTTAQALPWDPGSSADLGVFDLTLIERGLLAGSDGDRFSTFLTGRSGFFDFGVPDDTEIPSILVTEPGAGTITDSLSLIAGTAVDNREIASVTIRLRNITNGTWLQTDGTFAQQQVDLPVTAFATGVGSVGWSLPVNDLPPGDYEVRGFSSDAVGNTSVPLAHPFTVPGLPVCTVALDADERPVLTYDQFLENGVNTVVVRRDGTYLADAQAGSGTFTDVTAAPGDHSYVIRWRPGGVVTDIGCTPDPINVPEGGGGLTCTAGLDANGDPTLSWTSIDGVSNYVVREAGVGFVSTVVGETLFTDVGQAPGDYSYSIRYRQQGVAIDLACNPDPITVTDNGGPGTNTCTAAVDANGIVTLNWSPIDGEDRYIVRDNDGFVATVDVAPGDALTFVDAGAASGARTYVIRSRQGGTTTDVTCNPDPIVVP